jgi:serine/threonine-protein kinase
MKRAHDLDPVSPAISDGLSNTFEVRDNFEAAIENSQRYIELNPTFPGSYRNLAFYYSVMGRHAEAIAQAERAVQLDRASYLLGDLGYVYGAAGKRDQAMALVHELEGRFANNRSAGRYIAEIYSGMGEKEKAMEWLEKDFQTRNGRLAEIRWTVPYRSMHDYPPFRELLKRMGMPPL